MRRPKKPEELTPADAREAALRALGRREHSAAELKFKLRQRGHADDLADAIVGELETSGWQSDHRYAEMLARSRVSQGYGPLRIRAELEAAHVPDGEIDLALRTLQCDFRELARRVHARKFRQPADSAAEWQKQYRFLAGRGFEAAQIRAALKREPED
jgi:regulatory protein